MKFLINDIKKSTKVKDIRAFRRANRIKKDDVIILCGTTANINNEQLYKVVDEISKLNFNISKKIKFIFSMTYQGNRKSIIKFKKYTRSLLGDKSIFFTNFLSEKQISCLRTITDVYINMRISDQFVATMIESFYFNTYVITGSWLPYSILDKEKFYYSSVKELSGLNDTLNKLFRDGKINLDQKRLDFNRKLALKLWSPNQKLKEWISLYKEIT